MADGDAAFYATQNSGVPVIQSEVAQQAVGWGVSPTPTGVAIVAGTGVAVAQSNQNMT